MYYTNSIKAGRRRVEVHCYKLLKTCEVIQYHLKVDCDKLKMHTINLKATTKITKQRIIANKPIKVIKQNHRSNAQLNFKMEREREREENKEWMKQMEN